MIIKYNKINDNEYVAGAILYTDCLIISFN